MKNAKPVLNRLEYIIEQANLYRTPADAAQRAVKEIDEKYIVIKRSLLPQVSRAQRSSGSGYRVGEVTDINNSAAFHRNRAVEHLAMWEFLSDEGVRKEAEKMERRKAVWSKLFPEGDCESAATTWSWDSQFSFTQRSIDMIIDLEDSLQKTSN